MEISSCLFASHAIVVYVYVTYVQFLQSPRAPVYTDPPRLNHSRFGLNKILSVATHPSETYEQVSEIPFSNKYQRVLPEVIEQMLEGGTAKSFNLFTELPVLTNLIV